MESIDNIALLLGIGVAAICGAVTGRAFAIEGENRRTSILAAAYCGGGAGLLSATLVTFAVVLIGAAAHPEGVGAAVLSAGGAIGAALLWGVAAGAAGGLAVGMLVAIFKRYAPR
jgi:hypothetical protein